MNSERCSQCKHFIIANTGEGKIYGCDRSKCVFEPATKNDLGVNCIDKSTKCKHKCIDNDLEIDCISRADAIKVASGYCHPSNVAKELAKLPSVTPQEPRKGHWIVNKKIDTAYDISGYKSWAISYVCEHCGFIHQAIENHGVYNFCPNCGADMREVESEDKE